jgi:hypothetical protein
VRGRERESVCDLQVCLNGEWQSDRFGPGTGPNMARSYPVPVLGPKALGPAWTSP